MNEFRLDSESYRLETRTDIAGRSLICRYAGIRAIDIQYRYNSTVGRQRGADDYCTDKSLGCLPWWAGLLVAGGLLCLSCWRWLAPRRLSSGLVETRTDSHSTTHTKDKLTKLSRKLLVFSRQLPKDKWPSRLTSKNAPPPT